MANKMPPRRAEVKKITTTAKASRRGPIGRAKVLTPEQMERAAVKAMEVSDYGPRDRLFIMLSRFCGLRSKEIANIHVADLTDAEGHFNGKLYVSERGAKYGKPRTLPLRPELSEALIDYVKASGITSGPIFWTQRGEPCTPNVVQKQIKMVYLACGYQGARSHSGRRSAITLMARNANTVEASLEDVRIWAGHAHIGTTGIYVDPSPRAEELTKLL